MPFHPSLMSIHEAAALLHVSRHFLHTLVREGAIIPAGTYRKVVLFLRQDVLRLKSALRIPGPR